MTDNRFNLIRCAECTSWIKKRQWNHKFCDDCRKIAYSTYRKRWNKVHRATLDRTITTLCDGFERAECGTEFRVYSADHGGIPRKLCPDCTVARRKAMYRAWRHSPAGQKSRERSRRRARGESVPDGRSHR